MQAYLSKGWGVRRQGEKEKLTKKEEIGGLENIAKHVDKTKGEN